jgi:hypothetical protein
MPRVNIPGGFTPADYVRFSSNPEFDAPPGTNRIYPSETQPDTTPYSPAANTQNVVQSQVKQQPVNHGLRINRKPRRY